MPRHDRYGDDTMSRDRRFEDMRSDRDFRDRDDQGAFFGRGRMDRDDRTRGLSVRGRSDRGERSYGPDDYSNDIPMNETERLIASNKVEGTPVYDRNGDRLGSVYNFMVDKFRGQVVYAVLRHGKGFLGLDERYYPLDWNQLTYDTRLGGYHVDMTEEQLTRSGSWDSQERWQGRRSRMSRDRDRDRDYRPDFERGGMSDRW
jgi:sporulation protein YlmC with PRC-barrel domain